MTDCIRSDKVANLTVAADGSEQFTKINDAIATVPIDNQEPFTIHVKKGVYHEYVVVDKPNVRLVGDGMDVTIITGSRSNKTGYETSNSSTVTITAPKFIAMNLTIENSSPHDHHQAVALLMDSDQSIMYGCAIRGHQDTIFANSGRQFYKKCTITGTVDMIFGDAAAVFQECNIHTGDALTNVVLAHGRSQAKGLKTGFILQLCNISRNINDVPLNSTANSSIADTYLGRPWRPFSRSVVMQSFIGSNVKPEGWTNWDGLETPPTSGKPYYGEYNNTGPGSDVQGRVNWTGYHILDDRKARVFTVDRFINGSEWLPATLIPYIGGLA
ncbi:hypothetical protein ACFE04_010284 [Oxalis oulophora]